jgi:hypothetical protein
MQENRKSTPIQTKERKKPLHFINNKTLIPERKSKADPATKSAAHAYYRNQRHNPGRPARMQARRGAAGKHMGKKGKRE